MNIIKMSIPCDFSVSGFLEAEMLMREVDSTEWIMDVIVAEENYPEGLIKWLWHNRRATTIWSVPKEILKTPYTWAARGMRNTVLVVMP